VENLLNDLSQSVRMFRRNPGFTAAAVAALTLGIGANTAIIPVPLIAVALAAVWIPASRASRVDPAIAPRAQ
jgi:hypothetical protein